MSCIENGGKDAVIVKAVIGLGRSLGLPVVAEGVENDRQLKLLRRQHCTSVQGWLIGRPLPIAEWASVTGALDTAVEAA